jgi:DNA-binding transcriptional LysR family regulator
MNWNDIRYFLVVARTLSLTDAARELQVTQSTVARRLVALEKSLGASLFLRRPDGYQLTERGAALIGAASEAEAYLHRVQREAAAPIDSMTGTVRVALPELLGQQLLIPSFATFQERYPDVHLDFIADVRPEKLTTRQDDVLLRLVQPTHGDYYVRRIGSIILGLYCSADYASRHGLPRRDADLGAHRLIGWDQHLTYLPLARWMIDKAPNAMMAVRTHSMSSQLAAAEAGMGIAVLPAIVARKHGLVRTLGDEEPFQAGLWLLQHADTRRAARVEAVSDHLSSFVKSHAAELESAE